MRINKLDIIWWGWPAFFELPFLAWGTWHPDLEISSYKYLIIGPVEIRKWKTLKDLDKDFWAE